MADKRLLMMMGALSKNKDLLTYVDASIISSYNPIIGGTNWNDLTINNYDFTLFGGTYNAENEGVINFSGGNQFAYNTVLPTDLIGNPTFSVSGWFKRVGSNTSKSSWGFGSFGAGPNNINSFMLNANEISISVSNVNVIGSNFYYSDTQYQHIVWVKRAGAMSRANVDIYVNGVKRTGASLFVRTGGETIVPNVTALNGIAISKSNTNNDSTQIANMRVANFKVYKKELIESEVLADFNATKTKYGY